MGNRILKESVLTSRKLSRLSWFEQVMFDHLIVAVDDYGTYFADPVLLAHTLFPRSTDVTEKMIRDGLKHLEEQKLIFRYTAEGETYLKLVSWEKHQRLRTTRRQFPTPPEEAQTEPVSEPVLTFTPAEESTSEPILEETTLLVPETPPEPEVRELPVVELPLNDNTVYGVTREEVEEYESLYPAVDVRQELRNMRGWCSSHPERRKTKSGIRKFINSWLARAQDKGGTQKAEHQVPYNPFAERVRAAEEAERKCQVS